jgi:hypothetical protein
MIASSWYIQHTNYTITRIFTILEEGKQAPAEHKT